MTTVASLLGYIIISRNGKYQIKNQGVLINGCRIICIIRENNNRTINSNTIADFIGKHPHLDSVIKERMLLWKSELDYWDNIKEIYPYMELGYHYRSLIKTLSRLIEPSANEVWLDAGCGPAKMSELLWNKSGKKLRKIMAIDIVLNCRRTHSADTCT